MSVTLFNKDLKEARRDALVSHYLATHRNLKASGINLATAEDLYEYLLLDTEVSDAVTTSRLSEAVASLQLFIHRALEGYDGKLAPDASALLAQDGFLDNWDRYNKRYSTWAGKEKLRFYAANYIDPTLRGNKTAPFTALEEQLSQGKISESQAEQAFTRYISDISGYERYSDLGYTYDGYSQSFYLSMRIDKQYYWQQIKGVDYLTPIFSGEWQPLPPAIKNPVGKVVVSAVLGGVICRWTSKESQQSEDGKEPTRLVDNIWQLKRDKTWEETTFSQLVFFAPLEGEYTQLDPETVAISSSYIDDGSQVNLSITAEARRDKLKTPMISIRVAYNRKKAKMYYRTFDQIDEPLEVDKENSFKWISGASLIVKGENGALLWQKRFFYADLVPGLFLGEYFILYIWKAFTVNPYLGLRDSLPELDNSVTRLLRYDTQKTISEKGEWFLEYQSGGDAFTGIYGQYLWEIFFHIPFLIATRFATEQRFDDAERWYKYIFNSAGYRDDDGKLLTDEKGNPRYWNCLPLEQDSAWDRFIDMPASTDPDVIATADPMHYKLAVFMGTLDLLIARGDAAYRMLERDTLTEAKMYYVQAQQLLGPRPDIRITSSWDNPTLADEASKIALPATRTAEPLTFARWLKAGNSSEMGDGDFLPPYNDVLLAYWDKLDIRLWNLRHNLSLDGQPLNLPLFAAPVDPAALHRQQGGGDGVQADARPSDNSDTGWRYPLLAEHARSAAGLLSQFGSSLLSALERRDAEQLTLLLQTQQIAVLGLQQDMAQKNLDSLTASRGSLQLSRAGAEMRKTHYGNLINGDLSPAERAGLTLRTASRTLMLSSQASTIAGGALSVLPNTFGLANGGGDYGAPLHAAGQVIQALATASDQSAVINDLTAGYQRRSEEWALQRDIADNEISQLDAQLDSLNAQIAMQQKQIALTETESAHAQALYELQSSRFTGQALYNWMVSRLSTLYYQLYDATIPVCLQARHALTRELGADKAQGLFRAAVWNDLYQGLLAGEGLTTELQKLNAVWLQHSALGLEATRTVSLAALRGEKSGSLSAAVAKVLGGQSDTAANGTLKSENQIFSATLDMAKLDLQQDYGTTGSEKKLFIKSIAVTLPTLLGPYQDIAATLSSADGQVATLSHGLQDTGRFVTNLEDSRFQPFEGLDPTGDRATLTLSIFNVQGTDDDAAPNQRAIVENLSDIIFHIRYIMRSARS